MNYGLSKAKSSTSYAAFYIISLDIVSDRACNSDCDWLIALDGFTARLYGLYRVQLYNLRVEL